MSRETTAEWCVCALHTECGCREKLRQELLSEFVSQWQTWVQPSSLESKVCAVLELYQRFPLDVAVTGGTKDTNERLARVLCGATHTPQEEECEESETEDEESDEVPDQFYEFLNRELPNVRFWPVEDLLSSTFSFQPGACSSLDRYQALVVLTSELLPEDHLRLSTELHERNKTLVLVRVEPGWDLQIDRNISPCKTCAWERMRQRCLEAKQQQGTQHTNMEAQGEDFTQSSGGKLIAISNAHTWLAELLPTMKKKTFCEFMTNVTRELRVPKLLRNNSMTTLSEAVRRKMMSDEDLSRVSDICQSAELTDSPAKLLSLLVALENFHLDVGVVLAVSSTNRVFTHPGLPGVRLWEVGGVSPVHPVCDLYMLRDGTRFSGAAEQLEPGDELDPEAVELQTLQQSLCGFGSGYRRQAFARYAAQQLKHRAKITHDNCHIL